MGLISFYEGAGLALQVVKNEHLELPTQIDFLRMLIIIITIILIITIIFNTSINW
jgi:hypothetical protein